MAPQESIPTSATILGTIGTVFWCIQLIPQIWSNFKKKSTEGVPGSMMFLWGCSGVPFGIYAIVQNLNIPIQCQAQIFTALSLICWGQCLYYGNKWRKLTAIGLPLFCAGLFGGLEAVGIWGIRIVYSKGDLRPITAIGILAAILLAAGLIPPYFEIYKRRGQVVGINLLFILIDALGAFFSLMSLVAQHTFDILGGVQYSVCLLLELGIMGCAGVWAVRTWWRKRRGKNVDIQEGDVVSEGGLEEVRDSVDKKDETIV